MSLEPAKTPNGRFEAMSSMSLILGTAQLMSFGILANATGLLKDLIVAHYFGVTASLDAFFLALLIPTFAINVLSGSLPPALVPALVRQNRQNRELVARTFSGYLLIGSVLISLILLSLFPFSLHLLTKISSVETSESVMHMFWIIVPCITVFGLNVIWTATLHAYNRFAFAALSQILVPLVTMATLLVLFDRLNVYSLAVGTTLGYLVQSLLVAAYLRRSGARISPVFRRPGETENAILQQYYPVLVSSILLGSTMLIDQWMAATLKEGSVSALVYGTKLVAVVLSIGTTAIGTILTPELSRLSAANDYVSFSRLLRTSILYVTSASVILLLFFLILSDEIIRILLERGAFTAEDTDLVSRVQIMYAIQIPFFAIGMLFVRALSSMLRNRILMWGTAISLPLNILLNFIFMQVLGVAGIALSTSIVYLVSACFLGFWTLKTIRLNHQNPAFLT